jgi:hypothetical protein
MNITKKVNIVNMNSTFDFPVLNNKKYPENINNFNFIDATKKKVDKNKDQDGDELCTIYYDKNFKKIVTHNYPTKNYNDDDDHGHRDNDDSDIRSIFLLDDPKNETIDNNMYNIKYPILHYGMNKAIRTIMERRDKFIDQYGVDEYIRDYLPKDSPFLYSRYYYKNKNNYKNYKLNNRNNQIVVCDNNLSDSAIENELIYDDLYIDVDLDVDLDVDNDEEIE